MIDLKKLREEMEQDKKKDSTWGSTPSVVLELLDLLSVAQKDAARYRYLTQQHGDYCITDAMENTSGVFKAGAADSVIDAAMASQS